MIIEHRLYRQRAQLPQAGAGEFLAHGIGDQARRAFHRFQGHIAGESVRDDDVDLVRENIVALDETDIVEIAVRQQIMRRLNDVVALDFFFSDVEQTHARIIVRSLQIGGEHGAHHRELR